MQNKPVQAEATFKLYERVNGNLLLQFEAKNIEFIYVPKGYRLIAIDDEDVDVISDYDDEYDSRRK